MPVDDLHQLNEALASFNKARDWEQFHSPKNLAMALSVECSELLEIFQWLGEDESRDLAESQLKMSREEVGDVMICLLNLCRGLKFDPVKAAWDKLAINEKKYPIEKSRGSARKYSDPET